MGLLGGLVVFGLALALITVIGHGLWMLVAALFRGGANGREPPRRRGSGRRQRCVGCGESFAPWLNECPACGLDPADPAARELRELEITAGNVQRLVDRGGLDPAVGEQVYRSLEARQTRLLKAQGNVTAPPSLTSAAGGQSAREHLERLLATCNDVRNLTYGHRKDALACYRQVPAEELPSLSSVSLLALARLLRMAALSSRALQVYETLIKTHGSTPEASLVGALEAGRLAHREHKPDQARWFLEHALAAPLPPAERDEAEVLLRSLPPSGEVLVAALAEAGPAEAVRTEQPAPPVATPELPAAPQRSWGQMLAGFMEARNILWGELVGGLLIVGCSIALVISLWQTLEQIPYFPFLVLLAVTSALFGAGLYTLGHWNLEATSRGLLVIAVLLTPLDFLVLAGLTREGASGSLDWATKAAALGIFTAMVVCSGRILVKPALSHGRWRADWLLALAVVGASATQLVVLHWLDAARPVPWQFALLSLAPALCQGIAVAGTLIGLGRRERVEAAAANVLYLFLGLAVFAVAVALGFIVYWSQDAALTTFQYLALPIAAASLPLCVSGAVVHRKLEEQPADKEVHGLPFAFTRLTATVLVLVGAAMMLGSLVLAWPRPLALLATAGLSAFTFFGLAWYFRLAYAHIPGLACLVVAFLTGFFTIRGDVPLMGLDLGPQLLALWFSPGSGSALTSLAVALAGSSEWLARRGRPLDSLYHVAGSGVTILAALLLVGLEAGAVPVRGAVIFGIAGLGALIVNLRWRQAFLTHAGSVALLGSIIYIVLGIFPGLEAPRLWAVGLLTHATSLVLASILLAGVGRRYQNGDWLGAAFIGPLRNSGLGSSLLALVPVIGLLSFAVTVDWNLLAVCCRYTLWLSAVWLIVAWVQNWPALFAAFQSALTVAVLLGVVAFLHTEEWFADQMSGLIHLWSLQAYALALGLLSLAWLVVRRLLWNRPRAQALLEPGWRTIDLCVFAAVVVGQLALAVYAIWPEMVDEIVPLHLKGIFLPLEPYRPLATGMAWALLGTVTTALGVSLLDRRPHEAVLGLVVSALTLALLAAYGFRAELAVGSALRWTLAVCFVGCSALLWARARLFALAVRFGVLWSTSRNVPALCRAMLIALAVVPVLLMTGWIALMGFSDETLPGPLATSIFERIGWVASMTVPLGIIALGLVGHGMRERAAGYIFAAGLIVLALATGGHALAVVGGGGVIDLPVGVFIVQRGILAASLWALGWLWTRRWRNWRLLDIQLALSILGNLALLAPALVGVLGSVTGVFSPESQIGRFAGWLALLATMAASIWYVRLRAPKHVGNVLAAGGVGLSVLAACVAADWDPGGWLAYHVLTLAGSCLALVLLLFSWAGSSQAALGPVFWSADRRARAAVLVKELFPPTLVQRWIEVLSACVVALAFGGTWGDPVRPYWSCAATLAVSLLFGAMAVWVRRPVYVYVSGLLVTVVGYLIWQGWLVERWNLLVWFALGPDLFDRLILVEIICLAASSACWSLVELWLRRRQPPVDVRGNFIPYAHAAALLAVHLLAMLILIGVVGNLVPIEVNLGGPLVWIAWLVAGLALVACLWDTEARALGLPLAPLYLLGLLAIGLILHQYSMSSRMLAWSAAVPLAGFVLAVNVLLRFTPWTVLRQVLRLPGRADGWLTGWFLPSQTLLACLVLGLSLWICLDFAFLQDRLVGPLSLLLLVIAGILLAARWPDVVADPERIDRRYPCVSVLCLVVLAATEAAWALLDPEMLAPWLHRNVLLLAVLVVSAAVHRAVSVRVLSLEPTQAASATAGQWAVWARWLAPRLAVLAGLVLAIVLVQEFLYFDPAPDVRRPPMALAAVILVAVILTGVIGGAIRIAVFPQHDPFALSARGRVWCVWGAEIVLVLLLVHLRLTVPHLFQGFISRHWPFIVLAVGFVGVGLGELCARRGLPMLAEPLHRTGLFLPLLPLVAYLVRPLADFDELGNALPGVQPFLSFLNRLTHPYGVQALVWFAVGLLYAWTAVLRRASGFALLDALFANFGLWVIYAHQEGLGFILHPQIWLIPLGLIFLAAEHLERDHLTPAQRQAARYAGLLLIYLSSTADMFITGLGDSVVLPVVLALLSVAGVLAGILLRVRAFLFLGISFLFLVVFSQIWYAAVNRAQTWVWWASGIVLGAAILALFALFEKRRNDVLKLIEEIKAWK